jgi:glycosyltransferase involved in cell wall biosynthesis
VDTLFETPGLGTGGVTYLTSLVRAASKVAAGDAIVVLCSAANRCYFEDIEGVELVDAGWSNEHAIRRIASQQFLVDRRATENGCDVLLGAGNSVPLWGALPSVVVVHSSLWLEDVARTGLARRFYRRALVEASCRKARRVIAVSQYLADVIAEQRPALKPKIRTVLEGVGADYSPAKIGPDPFEGVHAKGDEVVLFSSTLLPYKNLDVVIRALGHLGSNGHLHLMVCGGSVRDEQVRLRALTFAEGVENRVTFFGHVAHERMPSMNAWADMAVYPSRSEAFGLPLVEAMASGTPVVAARTSCIPEVSGGAAVLFDPDDYVTLAAELTRMRGDGAFRRKMVELGLRRAAELNWEQAARDTLHVLREALEQ